MQNADAPYDSAALADLVLRSSDFVDFYVLRTFLRYVSPVFRTMLTINTGQVVGRKDGHPVISVAEDSKTLRLLLEFIYPTSQERSLDDVGLFWKAAKASQKYCMEIVEKKLRKRVLASGLMKDYSLQMYVVATNLRWDGVAIAAARQTLQTQLEMLPYVFILKDITGADFYRFLEYRLRCNKSSDPMTEEFKKFSSVAQPCLQTDGSISDASIPFDSSAPADLILRSSDSVDFFVLGGLMRRLSVVFKDMFPFSSTHEVKNGIPIVRVEENSEVLRSLLSVIYYEVDEPDMKKCQLYIQVVLAARKYKMTTIERRLYKQAASTRLIINDPLRIYIVTTALGWTKIAKTEALNTFYQPLEKLPYVDELQLITGEDLNRLVRFRFRCAVAASNALQGDKLFPYYGFGQWNSYFKSYSIPQNGTTYSTFNFSLDKRDSPPKPVIYDTASLSLVYTQLKIIPRGSTVSDIYSKHLGLVTHDNGKFEMTPTTFFNIMRYAREAEKKVESAVKSVIFL